MPGPTSAQVAPPPRLPSSLSTAGHDQQRDAPKEITITAASIPQPFIALTLSLVIQRVFAARPCLLLSHRPSGASSISVRENVPGLARLI